MRNKARLRRGHDGPAAGARPLRGAAHRLDRGHGARARAAPDQRVTVTASPEQGAGGDPRPGRAADRPRLHRRPAPRRPDGPRPRRARGDLRPAHRPGHRPGLRARRRRRPARRLPRRAVAARGPRRARPPVRARRHHRLPRVAPDHQRRPHHPVDVGQAPLRHPRGQQPDLRPRGAGRAGSAGCASAASPCRCCWASPARSTAPSCWRWPPRSASGSRPGSWSSTRAPSPGWPRPAASPASGSSRRSRPPLSAPEMLVEGLHVFTFNQVAATGWRVASTQLLRA